MKLTTHRAPTTKIRPCRKDIKGWGGATRKCGESRCFKELTLTSQSATNSVTVTGRAVKTHIIIAMPRRITSIFRLTSAALSAPYGLLAPSGYNSVSLYYRAVSIIVRTLYIRWGKFERIRLRGLVHPRQFKEPRAEQNS